MKSKRITALIVSLIMMVTLLSPIAAYADNSAVITVPAVSELPGATVDVAISIKNNPGILGASVTLTYDNRLTLNGASNGDAFSPLVMTKPGKFTSPCNFMWDGQDLNTSEIADGSILILQFTIPADAKAGDKYAVKVSYGDGDIVDYNLNEVAPEIVNGYIEVVDYTPGDLDGNSKVNATDVIMLRRYIAGGYEQEINERAANVNDDGKRNATDVILIRRFIAGGYNVELIPESPKCAHIMTATEYKEPTCTEDGNIAYWYCSECERYFSDEAGNSPVAVDKTVLKATGHTVVIDPAVEPTYDNEGRTQGSHCSVCNEVLVAQTIIPALKKEEYAITYHVSNNDKYLAGIDIYNPNPDTYSKEDGIVLEDLMVQGYNFVGWFTAQVGGNQVTEIAAGTTGNKTLYAHWEAVTYTVQYASKMMPQSDSTYTAATGLSLPTPVLDKYTFIGWSDENGKMWDKIPVGSSGNMTLYANWSSDRNKAVAKTTLDDPIIVEDTENGRILFTYEIGEIRNVPLYTTLNLQCANGIITTVSQTTETRVERDVAKNIAKTVANSTANTTSWTLSNDWSESTEVNEEYLEENKVEREDAEKLAKSQKGTYSLKSSVGETDGYTQNSGGSYKLSQNNAYSETIGYGTETSVGLSVDTKYSTEISASAGGSIPGVGSAEVGTKTGFEVGVGMDFETSLSTNHSGTGSWSTDEEFEQSYSNTSTAEKSWSSEAGYEVSNEESRESSVTNTISKLVSQKYGYGKSYQEGGSRSEYADVQASQSESDEYSSSIAYHQGEYEIKTKTFESTGNTVGNYRMVMAGTMHVFAVVGYDIATNSYFVYTHNQMDDVAEEYLDYSWNHQFDDYETSIIPFEVPYFVNKYVNNRIAKTSGLEFDPDSGIITDYIPTGEQADEIVVIPSYWSVNNGDGTYTAHKVTGIAEKLFAGNTDIKAVQLGSYITEIPDNAFEGCSSLKYVLSPNIKKIGANAFSGCTSLASFTVPSSVTEIGANAFEGVPEVSASVSTVSMAENIAASGADGIVLNISEIPEDETDNMTFEIGEKTLFELRGGDRTYKGMSIKSDALTTIINGVTVSDNTKIPFEFSSENVTLDRVTVDCGGYAMVLKADTTNLVINRNIGLISSTENAVVARNVNISKLNSDISAKLNVTGNMLVCGEVDNTNYLNFTNGELKYISEEEYINYLTAHKITFDANGGTVATESKMASLNMPVGELPKPYRDYYTFDGWYTDAEGGELYTADTVMTAYTDITLYAHWVENDVSEWVPASELPTDAEVVDTKYTYTQTSYTTSSSSSMSGWTKYDTTSVWSDYGSWSAWQDGYVGGSDSRQVQTQSVVASSNYKTQYVYYRWAVGWDTKGCWKNKTSQYPNYFEYYSDTTLGYDSVNGGYKYWHTSSNYLIVWPASPSTRQVWVSDNYKTQYRYRDRHLIYTYYYTKDEAKESEERPTGDNISNVQEWVQYRFK